MAAAGREFQGDAGAQLAKGRQHRRGHEGVVLGLDHQGRGADRPKARPGGGFGVVVGGTAKTVERCDHPFVEGPERPDAVQVERRQPLRLGRIDPLQVPPLPFQRGQQIADQMAPVDPRQPLVHAVGAQVQAQRAAHRHRRAERAVVRPRQPVEHAAAAQGHAHGDQRAVPVALAQRLDHRVQVLDLAGVGAQGGVVGRRRAARVHRHRGDPQRRQPRLGAANIMGVAATGQAVQQQHSQGAGFRRRPGPVQQQMVAVRQRQGFPAPAERLGAPEEGRPHCLQVRRAQPGRRLEGGRNDFAHGLGVSVQ